MYVVFFFISIRIGHHVGRLFGPFETVEEASNWVKKLDTDSANASSEDSPEGESLLPSWSIVKLYKD